MIQRAMKQNRNLSQQSQNALKTDLYELTMAAGYFHHEVDLVATFELFCHTMPENRNYLIVCGLHQVIEYILNLRFTQDEIRYLKSLPVFKHITPKFFDYLKDFRFSGDVWAMPEGEIFFAHEPILQVTAPIIEAQILETYLLSVMNLGCLVATKASRIVHAACCDGQERTVIDFGSRRAHGPEAGILAARAAYIGGCAGTSNVYAGRKFGIPVFGTMAHSWIEAFDTEEGSFLRYHDAFPQSTILLIDTYDTLKATRKLKDFKNKINIKAVRIDSGDLLTLSKKVRAILDQQGLRNVKIIASGNLNEFKIENLVEHKAPIDIFGVGTDMAVSRDLPALDLTYKLVQIKDTQNCIKYKAKKSKGKKTVPGCKQVFRQFSKKGLIQKDKIGLFLEQPPKQTRPLLEPFIIRGKLRKRLPKIEHLQYYAQQCLSRIPPPMRDLSHKRHFKATYTPKIEKLKFMVLSLWGKKK